VVAHLQAMFAAIAPERRPRSAIDGGDAAPDPGPILRIVLKAAIRQGLIIENLAVMVEVLRGRLNQYPG
jgi:hypothetical protein